VSDILCFVVHVFMSSMLCVTRVVPANSSLCPHVVDEHSGDHVLEDRAFRLRRQSDSSTDAAAMAVTKTT
jgi:hypothetical protein